MVAASPPDTSGASGMANPIVPTGLSMELTAALSGPSALTGTAVYPNAVAAVPVTPVHAHEVPSTEMNPPRRTIGPLNNPTFRGVGYNPQPSHDRHHSRRQGRKRQSQKSVASWMWLKLCCRIRKSTMEFFDAVDAGRVELVRDMVRASPALLLRTRPGTRWTAVHFTAERGEYATLTALFEEAQTHDERRDAHSTISCARLKPMKKGELTKRMVNALTEKNLTPLMLACKRGCAPLPFCPSHDSRHCVSTGLTRTLFTPSQRHLDTCRTGCHSQCRLQKLHFTARHLLQTDRASMTCCLPLQASQHRDTPDVNGLQPLCGRPGGSQDGYPLRMPLRPLVMRTGHDGATLGSAEPGRVAAAGPGVLHDMSADASSHERHPVLMSPRPIKQSSIVDG